MQQLPVKTPAEKRRVERVMTRHISEIVGRYRGKVATWDVVNEPMSRYDKDSPGQFRDHVWLRAMGESYISKAFLAARRADPKAKLFINDFGLEEDGPRWNAFLKLMAGLKKAGIPVDGVGFQAHVYRQEDKIDVQVLRKHVRQLAAIGLSSRISEMDVLDDPGKNWQAEQYANVLDVCFSEPSCTSFTTWGVSDRYNLFKDDNGHVQQGADLLWDANMDATPAVSMMRSRLR